MRRCRARQPVFLFSDPMLGSGSLPIQNQAGGEPRALRLPLNVMKAKLYRREKEL
jgi:hypothetical protein